jgi:hypothetical protein
VTTVPMKVSKVSEGELPTIGLCIAQHGPYTFVVDTGSARSIIDSSLAASLDLGSTGGQTEVALGGSGCATTGKLVHVPSMQTGDVVLAPQDMVESSLSDWAGKKVDGVLGSDALGRFQGIKLDLTHQKLSFEGAQGAGPTSHVLFVGPPNAAASPALLNGATPIVTAPMTIVKGPGSITPFANLTVANHGPYSFVVNTGSPTSSIDKTIAFTNHLAGDGNGPTQAGVGCGGSVPRLAPTPVQLSAGSSQSLRLRSVPITGAQRPGIVGTLGLDYLGTYGTIVVDYTTAALALANG